jgi:archaellum component FlaC
MFQYISLVEKISLTSTKSDSKLDHLTQLPLSISHLSKRAEDILKKISYIQNFDLSNGELRKTLHELKDTVEAMNNLEFKFDFMEGFEEQSKGIEQRLKYLESLDLKIKGLESGLDVFKRS